MRVFVYSLDKTLYEGEADVVTLPSETGELAILPNHAALITALKAGEISYRAKKTNGQAEIKNGFACVENNTLVVLAEQ